MIVSVTWPSIRKTYFFGVHSTENTWYFEDQSSPYCSGSGSQPPAVLPFAVGCQ